jgi:hypothetical protein
VNIVRLECQEAMLGMLHADSGVPASSGHEAQHATFTCCTWAIVNHGHCRGNAASGPAVVVACTFAGALLERRILSVTEHPQRMLLRLCFFRIAVFCPLGSKVTFISFGSSRAGNAPQTKAFLSIECFMICFQRDCE